jgi:hypothetical protein
VKPKPKRHAAKAQKHKKVKRKHVLAATQKRARKPTKKAQGEVAAEVTRVAAPASASDGNAGVSAILFVVSALLAVSLLLIATAAVPPWVLPARVGPTIARHRGDLATAGVTGAICLLFAFLIAWMA